MARFGVLGTGIVGRMLASKLVSLGHDVRMGSRQAGNEKENLAGKILIDVAVPLDFSQEMPPTLTVCNTDSLAEQIQLKVVIGR